jgi:hypothetical protein
MNEIRPLISRAIAPFIAALLLRLTLATGVEIPGLAESLTETATLLVLAAFAAVTGVGHKLMDRWINPTDAAAPTLALNAQLPQVEVVEPLRVLGGSGGAPRPPRAGGGMSA